MSDQAEVLRGDAASDDTLRRAVEILEQAPGWVSGRHMAELLGLPNSREVRRQVIWPLRRDKRLPIYSLPGPEGGYKLRATAEEHRRCLAWLDQHGRDELAIRAIIRQEGIDVVVGQMVMDFLPATADGRPAGREDQLSLLIDAESRRGRRARWTDVLEHLLAVMSERPEEYAEPIARIRERHGGLFLPADKLAAAQAALSHAQDLLRAG